MIRNHTIGLVLVFLGCLMSAGPANAASVQETFLEGNGFYQSGRYEEALQRYQSADALSPGLWQVKTAMGHCMVHLQRFREALAAYEQSLASHPDPALQSYVDRLKTILLVPAPPSTATQTPTVPATIAAKTEKPGVSSVVFLGLALLPGKVSGIVDAVLSDRLVETPEGGMNLTLGEASKTRRMAGVELGGEFTLRRHLAFILEGRFSPHHVNTQSSLGLLGFNLHLLEKPRFTLGFAPKVGYGCYTVDVGKATWVSGTVPPVLLPEGMVSDGDPVKVRVRGILAETAFQGFWRAGHRAGLFGRVGYLKTIAPQTRILAGSAEIPTDHSGLLKTDGSGQSAGLKPTGGLDGLTVFIGIAFFR